MTAGYRRFGPVEIGSFLLTTSRFSMTHKVFIEKGRRKCRFGEETKFCRKIRP